VGRHHPERFSFRAQSIGETVHPTLNRRGPGATPGGPMFLLPFAALFRLGRAAEAPVL